MPYYTSNILLTMLPTLFYRILTVKRYKRCSRVFYGKHTMLYYNLLWTHDNLLCSTMHHRRDCRKFSKNYSPRISYNKNGRRKSYEEYPWRKFYEENPSTFILEENPTKSILEELWLKNILGLFYYTLLCYTIPYYALLSFTIVYHSLP